MAPRPVRALLASLKQLRGARPRDVQERADLHRLFLFTRLYELEREAGEGAVAAPAAAAPPRPPSRLVADAVLAEARALDGDDAARREAVAMALRRQALALASAVHGALDVDGGDPAPAAAALREWGSRRRRGAGGGSGPMPRPGPAEGGGSDGKDESDDDDDAASDAEEEEADKEALDRRQQQQRRVVSARELASLAARRVGFGLRVGPSRVGHREAGLGLFVAAAVVQQASAAPAAASTTAAAPCVAVPAGALIALFPGLCYGRDDYRRMPGYPKVDRGNPYLAARYDGIVVDSQPWARGDGAGEVVEAGDEEEDASASASASAADAAASSGLDPFRPRRQALPRTFLARMARASDGPRLPPSAAAALREASEARRGRARWCSATTDEAAALELLAGGLPLEGRNPYALAHFANHPQPGQPPNAMIAPIDLAPCVGGEEEEGEGKDASSSSSSSSSASSLSSSSFPPELRAYLPFAPYEAAAALTVWPVERALQRHGEEAAVAAARRLAARPPPPARRGAAELAGRGARGLGLVALRPLADGEEVVFDYRLSPGMLGRPSWYVPIDEQAEDRRWA